MAWKTSYYHFDAVGSTRLLTDSDQNVRAAYPQTAFGKQLTSSSSVANPFRFVGQLGYYHDETTDSYNVRQRVYDARSGRWMSQDPARSDHNLFRYVQNCPVGYSDPSGLVLGTPQFNDVESAMTIEEYIRSLFPAGEAPDISISGKGEYYYFGLREGDVGQRDFKLIAKRYWELKNEPESKSTDFAIATLNALISPNDDILIYKVGQRLGHNTHWRSPLLAADRSMYSTGGPPSRIGFPAMPHATKAEVDRSFDRRFGKPTVHFMQTSAEFSAMNIISEVIIAPILGEAAAYMKSLFFAKAAAETEVVGTVARTVELYSYHYGPLDASKPFLAKSGRVYLTSASPGPWLTDVGPIAAAKRFVRTGSPWRYPSTSSYFTTGAIEPAEWGLTPIWPRTANFWKRIGGQYHTAIGTSGFQTASPGSQLLINSPIGSSVRQIWQARVGLAGESSADLMVAGYLATEGYVLVVERKK